MLGLAAALLPAAGAMAQPTAPAALAAGYAYPERDVRLRAEPARYARTVSSVPRNYPVRVGLCEQGWCEVEYVGVRGYVRAEFLRFADVPSLRPSRPPPPSPADAAPAAVIETNADTPPVAPPAAVVDPISPSASARLHDTDEPAVSARSGPEPDRTLNAPSTADPVPAQPAPAADELRVGYLLADKVYRKPDAFANEVTTINRGDRVRIAPLSGSDGWYEVYLFGAAELVGYAFTPYVSRTRGNEGNAHSRDAK